MSTELQLALESVILIEEMGDMYGTPIRKNLSEQVAQAISIAETLFHNQILGIYLYGSATMGGLHPDSEFRQRFSNGCCRKRGCRLT